MVYKILIGCVSGTEVATLREMRTSAPQALGADPAHDLGWMPKASARSRAIGVGLKRSALHGIFKW